MPRAVAAVSPWMSSAVPHITPRSSRRGQPELARKPSQPVGKYLLRRAGVVPFLDAARTMPQVQVRYQLVLRMPSQQRCRCLPQQLESAAYSCCLLGPGEVLGDGIPTAKSVAM